MVGAGAAHTVVPGRPRPGCAWRTTEDHWNGATRVTQWRVLHGSTAANLTPLTTAAWNGASTPITLPQKASGYYQVEALDSAGKVIGRSVPLSAE